MTKLTYGFFILLTFYCCQSNEMSNENVFIGGDIINPSNSYVTLYDPKGHVDTLYLNSDNKFLHHFTDFNKGIHSFVHGGKHQSLLLEDSDSIMMHINTNDFDGSLTFNGNGAKKNNYLIKLLSRLENQNSTNNNLYKQEPSDFHETIISEISKNSEDLNLFLKNSPNSDLFVKIALSTIKYHYFTKKELYQHRHFGYNSSINSKKIPSDFYEFRKEIIYNDKDLKDFYPYYNFLFPHINNLSFEQLKADQKICDLESNNLEYTNYKLILIDSLVTNPLIKNNLLKYTVRNFISNSKSIDKSYILYQSYLDKSSNVKDKTYIKNLFKNTQGLQPGHKLPSVEVIDSDNIKSNLNLIFDNTTVLYFWDNASRYHFENSHIKVNTLNDLFPEIDFIAININSMHTNAWKNMLYAKQYSTNNEYRFANPSFAKKRLAINYIKKVLIVDKKGFILNSTADLFDSNFEDVLEDYK
jgi:hypothetical protein